MVATELKSSSEIYTVVVKYFYSQKTGCYLHFTGAKKSAIKKTLSTSSLYCKIVPIKILILTENDNIHKDKLNKSDGQTNNAKKGARESE